MLISYKWLQDYVNIPWDPAKLAQKLTMAGLEVEGISRLAPDLPDVYIGFITKLVKHPEADNLNICTVDVGEKGKLEIVCGAPNVAQGQTVAVALAGAVLPNGLEIKPTEIRGIISNGMLCSELELGLGEDHDGIWLLPKDLTPGSPLVEAVGLDDFILDVSVYANRPDCMSVLGIAREVAALTGGKIKIPSIDYTELETPISKRTSVSVEDPQRCPRYTAALLEDVTLGDSPLWMQLRLKAAGMRPINNVVDITNYVMLETGQPLHAFDFDQLAEKRLIIRTAKPGEKMVTLDGINRELSPEMLLICDAHDPKCIAGVMGGLDSEVTKDTTQILLETANFAPLSIRRTSRALGLSSESSARFEKGIDPSGTMFASKRALHLLQDLAQAKIFAEHIDIDASPKRSTIIELSFSEIERVLGVSVPEDECIEILESLDFEVKKLTSEKLKVTIPSYRTDLSIPVDLIEEIVRVWGLEKLPSTLPADRSASGGQSKRLNVADSLRQVLVGAGLCEALTYSFGRIDNNDRLLRFGQPMIKIQNPISEDLVALRHSLLPGLLTAISLNASRQQKRVALFEIGANYIGDTTLHEQPQEKMQLCITLWGKRHPMNWGLSEESYDFYDLKGLLELILPVHGLKWEKGAHPSLHPGRQGSIKLGDREIVTYGEVHPAVLRSFRIPDRVYAAEIALEELLDLFEITTSFANLARFPAVERDLAFVVDKQQPVGELITELLNLGGDFLQNVTLFDVYEGKSIPEDKKSVAFSLHFQGDRTLTDDEITPIMNKCIEKLKSKFGAEIR